MSRTVYANLICLKLKCHVGYSSCILNAFFFQNVFPILISKGTTLHTSFRNILSIIDIIQRVFLNFYSVRIQIV